MFLLILTLTLCLTKAFVHENFEITSPPDYSNDPIYNVNDWVAQLQLQHCALVAIGLKYFAIFVEDEILGKNDTTVHRKYFLGICQQDILEEWDFCSPDLMNRRKYKCRFKLKNDKFQPRVHRRFCDFKIMINNKDCKCSPSIFGEQLFKVEGFPTCYIPPLPNSLCRYNVCGLDQCNPVTVEERIHTVNCSSKCKGKNPFCEHPTGRTSRFPTAKSFWSKWKRSPTDSADGKKLSVATCINKYTCPQTTVNCTCETFEENGTLKVKRTIYTNKNERPPRSLDNHCFHRYLPKGTRLFRYLRGTSDDDDDLEDDDDDDSDLDEDIVLEENPNEEKPVPTTEDLEKDEVVEEFRKDALEEVRNVTNSTKLTMKSNTQTIFSHGTYLRIVLVGGSCVILTCIK